MIKVMFVCLGNICRSPMAEFLLKDLVKKDGRESEFLIASAGTSYEEEGNPVHRGARRVLERLNINCDGKYAVRLEREDLDKEKILEEMRSLRDTRQAQIDELNKTKTDNNIILSEVRYLGKIKFSIEGREELVEKDVYMTIEEVQL